MSSVVAGSCCSVIGSLGVLPFLSPRIWRQMVIGVAQQQDKVIRNVGLGTMLLGVAMLYWVH